LEPEPAVVTHGRALIDVSHRIVEQPTAHFQFTAQFGNRDGSIQMGPEEFVCLAGDSESVTPPVKGWVVIRSLEAAHAGGDKVFLVVLR
jgi:hypothetical protein